MQVSCTKTGKAAAPKVASATQSGTAPEHQMHQHHVHDIDGLDVNLFHSRL